MNTDWFIRPPTMRLRLRSCGIIIDLGEDFDAVLFSPPLVGGVGGGGQLPQDGFNHAFDIFKDIIIPKS